MQPPGFGLGPLAEDFENEPGPVENLGVPRFLKVALLDGCQGVVDDDDLRFLRSHDSADLLDLARSEQGRGARLSQWHYPGEADVEPDGLGEARRLRQALRWREIASRLAWLRRLGEFADRNGHNSPRGFTRRSWRRRKVFRWPAAAMRLALLCSELPQRC